MRRSTIDRKTNETDISLSLNLDGSGIAKINTGIGFFDHMLTQIAVHGLIDLELRAKGDLDIDAHHTIEDWDSFWGRQLDRPSVKSAASRGWQKQASPWTMRWRGLFSICQADLILSSRQIGSVPMSAGFQPPSLSIFSNPLRSRVG